MSLTTHTISREGYSEAMDWLEETLTEMKVPQKELLRAELLVEENFLRLAPTSGNKDGFTAKITVRKRMGDVILQISAKGEAFNPIVALDETTDDEEAMINLAILKAYRNKMSYDRRQGENVVSILVYESGSKVAIYTLCGFFLGVFLGLTLKTALDAKMLLWIEHNLFTPVETIFMHALLMMIAPMIFFSVLSGITGMSDATDIGRMGGRLMAVSVAKLAVVLAASMALGLWLGAMPELTAMMKTGADTGAAALSIRDVIVDIVPGNMIGPFSTNNLLQVLFLACFFGILLVKAGEQAAWLKDIILFFNRFIMSAMGAILPVMPLVVAASMAKMMMKTDLSVLLVYGKIIAAVFLEFLLVLMASAVFVIVIGRISPIPFLKKIIFFSVLPFMLRSSNACMPETLKFCAKKLGVDEKLSMFSIPVGLQFNMTGCGAYIVMLALLLRLTFGLPVDTEFLLSFFFTVLLLTFTFPSVAGGTILVMASVFGMAGFPAAAVTLFIGIDPIVDCLRTANNVVGNVASSFLLARMEGKVDETIYNDVR